MFEKIERPIDLGYAKSLISLQPHKDSWFVGEGRTVLQTARNGFIKKGSPYGLFVCETRLLSRFEMRINDQDLIPVALSNVNQHSWLGYYIVLPPGIDPGPPDKGSGQVQPYSENTLEIRLTRISPQLRKQAQDDARFAESQTCNGFPALRESQRFLFGIASHTSTTTRVKKGSPISTAEWTFASLRETAA